MAYFNGRDILLAGLKGEPGLTPYIGHNGHWFIGSRDTGVDATPAGDRLMKLEDDVTSLNNKYSSLIETTELITDTIPKSAIECNVRYDNYDAYSTGDVSPADFILIEHEMYSVEWDERHYTCTSKVFWLDGMRIVYIGNGAYLGQSGNREPFVIIYNETANTTQIFSETWGWYTVRVYQTSIVQQLRPIYLPTVAVRAIIEDYINEALGGDY